MVTLSQPAIYPNPGESEVAFIQRAHYALMPTVRDPDQRNQMVWNAWDATNGNRLRDRARNYFPPEKYRHVESIPIFYEHETPGRDGSIHKYDFNELSRMCQALNGRADTNCYSAIASHHTSDTQKGPNLEPETIGYSGVFRMGMLGEDQPKWGIFCDEFHRNDRLATFDSRRRRSVEVLRYKDGRPPILDPIATLGADSPRLNLPVARYEASVGDIERYSFMSMASVGQTASFIPKNQYGGVDDYSMPGPGSQPPSQRSFDNEPQGSAMGPMAPDAVKQVLEGIRSLPEFAMMRELSGLLPHLKDMIQQKTVGISDTLGPDPASMPPAAPQTASPVGGALPAGMPTPPQVPPGSPSMPAPQPSHDDLSLPSDGPKPPMGSMPTHHAPQNQPGQVAPLPPPDKKEPYSQHEGNEVTPERYAALEAANTALEQQNRELREQYSALADANKRIMGDMRQQREAVINLERRAVDADRKDVINAFVEKYSGMADKAELYSECLYAEGSEMSNQEFYSYMGTMEKAFEKAAMRSPINMPMIPDGVTAEEASVDARYSAIMKAHETEKYSNMGYDEIEADLVATGKLPPRK